MGASPSRPPPRKYEIAYKAEVRRPNVLSRLLGSRSLRFVRQSSYITCADQRYSLESQLYSSESARNCVERCEFESSRVVEELLAFCSTFNEFAAWNRLPRRAQ